MKSHRSGEQECVADTLASPSSSTDVLVEGFSQNLHGNAAIQEHLRQSCAGSTADEARSHVGSGLQPLQDGALVGHIFFPSDSDTLDCDDEAVLEQIIQAITPALDAGADVELTMSGYADYRGSEAHNLDLSGRRADRVAQFFEQGLSGARALSVPEGETPQDETAPPIPEERRVDITLAVSLPEAEPDLSECPVVPNFDDHSTDLYDESWKVDNTDDVVEVVTKTVGFAAQAVGTFMGVGAASILSAGISTYLSGKAMYAALNHGKVLPGLLGGAYGAVAAALDRPVPQQPLQIKRSSPTASPSVEPAIRASNIQSEEAMLAAYTDAAQTARSAVSADIDSTESIAQEIEGLRAGFDNGTFSNADVDQILNDVFDKVLSEYGEQSTSRNRAVESVAWRRTLIWERP